MKRPKSHPKVKTSHDKESPAVKKKISPLPPGFFQPACVDAFRALARAVPVGGYIVEVGAHLGRSLGTIMPTCIERDINVYAVDIWEPYKNNAGVVPPWIAVPQRYEKFQKHMEKRGWWDHLTALKMRSEEGAEQFSPESVDLIHIDGAHDVASVTRDIGYWWPILKPGGVMVGHDIKNPQVLQAVKMYFDVHDTSMLGGIVDYRIPTTDGWKRTAGGKMWKAVKAKEPADEPCADCPGTK